MRAGPEQLATSQNRTCAQTGAFIAIRGMPALWSYTFHGKLPIFLISEVRLTGD